MAKALVKLLVGLAAGFIPGAVVGGVVGVFSLGLFMDGLIVGGRRIPAEEQILVVATIGGIIGAAVGVVIVVAGMAFRYQQTRDGRPHWRPPAPP